jgi:hypothetical protein
MTGLRRNALLALSLILMTTLFTGEALAQRQGGGGGGGGLAGPIELSATYGSMWGGNISLLNGKLRTATGPSYGFALDIPVHPAMAIEVSYTRQDGALDYDSRGSKDKLTDMSVNYWQIGAIRGLIDGKVRPFVTTSLGVTYYSPTESSVVIDGQTYNISPLTKFSFVLGLGVKSYFGEAEKIGLRASFKVLPTLYNTGGGVWFGTGGASLGVTGNAIWQWEAAAGLTVKFGG